MDKLEQELTEAVTELVEVMRTLTERDFCANCGHLEDDHDVDMDRDRSCCNGITDADQLCKCTGFVPGGE